MGITACNGGNSGDNKSQDAPKSQESAGGSGGESQPASEHKHSYGEWKQTKAPTCTEKGEEEQVCECGEKKTRSVAALGHDWSQWNVTVEATCAQSGSQERTCSRCGLKETEVIPQLQHDFGDGAEKVDVLEVEGSVKEEMYKCKTCTTTSIRWSSLEYDKTKTAERSTKNPESRGSGKAIRFDSTANYQDKDTTKKGCHIVYNVYIPEAIEKASIYMKTSKRTDNTLPPVVNIMEDDNAKGYEYVDGELVRPATRYGLKIDGEVVIVPEDTSGQEWKDGINWYSLPGEYKFETAGIHEIEFYNLGGYRADFYEFALVGFGPHEHVPNYKITDAKTNSAGKVVKLGVDSFSGEKAALIEMNQINGAYASSKTSAAGEPEAFGLGDADASFKAADKYKLDKGKVLAFEVDLTAAVTGAKIEVGAEFNNAVRYFYNMKIRGNETMTDSNADKDTEDAWRYYVKVNDGDFKPMGCEDLMQDVLDKTAGKYMPLGTFDLKEGVNMIYIRQGNIGYRVTMDNPLRVLFKGDATISGEHAHLFNEIASEVAATCEGKGSKVMKCVCGETETVETAPLGHDFEIGEADANGFSALTCKREGCTVKGVQFNGFTGDNASANDNGKLNKQATVNFAFNMPAAGKARLFINAAYSAGNGDKAFYTGWTIKGGTSADALTDGTLTLDTNARADSVLKQVSTYTFLEIGSVDVAAAGAYIISVRTYDSGAKARLMIDGLVRILY